MNKEVYFAIIIRYFLILLAMLLLTGFWMFALHTSISIAGVLEYYEKKSIFGLLETVSPHLFGMAVVFFILMHFFAVIKGVQNQKFYLYSGLIFLLIIISNISGFFIPYIKVFATLKLFSTIFLIMLSFYMMYKLTKVR